MFRISASELKRQFRRLGIKVDVEELNVARIELEKSDGKKLVMEDVQTALLVKMPGGASMLQIVGGRLEEVQEEAASIEISEEDVKLVAEQAGVSLDEARRALEETGGDIAAAILLLEERKGGS